MASVSSLDKDLRQLRLDRYTPQAANEVRKWIEEILGDRLPPGDLLDALKDGVALCRLVNHAVQPGVKFKQSAMPFVQMENISHFLRACQSPPLNLPDHDVFLTVDLYESKDPAQVLQCIGAFSRRANAVNPSAFPMAIGAKSKGASAMSPQLSGSSQGGYGKPMSGLEARARGQSNVSDSAPPVWNPLDKGSYAGRVSPTKTSSLAKGGLATGGPVSSWSNKADEGKSAPAWNIHQYGYMGGASQGNQGVAFGARRQITSAAPSAGPSLAEKERRRKQGEQAEAERQRLQAEEAEQRHRQDLQAEEERARQDEERRWEEETQRQRERERREAEEEKRRWDAEQRRWKEEEDKRLREERDLEALIAKERSRQRTTSDARLNGQFLSQYQAGQQPPVSSSSEAPRSTSEAQRIAELERQLEEAKAREREREERLRSTQPRQVLQEQSHSTRREVPPEPKPNAEDEWQESERDYLRKQWQTEQDSAQDRAPPQPPRPQPIQLKSTYDDNPPSLPNRPTPTESPPSPRPLPDPTPGTNRTSRFLSSNPAPTAPQPTSHRPFDYSTTTEVDLENQRRKDSQAKTKAGGWASKSLLEREMERERERQREWEEGQKETAATNRDPKEGLGPGQTWDVHQYGYMGGDSQNRGGVGLGVGGARRQIIGPRPPP